MKIEQVHEFPMLLRLARILAADSSACSAMDVGVAQTWIKRDKLTLEKGYHIFHFPNRCHKTPLNFQAKTSNNRILEAVYSFQNKVPPLERWMATFIPYVV